MANNNLGVSVTAGLDKPKSVTQINNDILKIEGQLKKLKLQAKIDGKSNAEIQKQISALNKQKRNLYVDLKLRQKDLKKQYKQAVAEINQKPIDVTVNTKNAQNQLSGLNNSVKTAKSETVTLGNTLTKTLNNMGLVVSAQTALNTIRKAAQEATDAVKEYDSYAKNLKIITNKDDVSDLIADYAKKSLDMKVDVSEYEQASEVILRAGKNIKESAEYTETAIKLAKTGFIEADQSASNLIVVANAFDISADKLKNLTDVLLSLDSMTNTTAGNLSSALSRSAQNAKLAGMSYTELATTIAKLRDTTGKSESEISNSLNQIFNRTYRVKLGKYILENEDGSTEDITQELSDAEKMLNAVNISIRNSKGEFKDFTEIISTISPKFKELDDVTKNSIANVLGGSYHKNVVLNLLEDWGDIQSLVENVQDKIGVTDAKYNAYLNSIEGKTSALSTAMKDLWNNLIPNGFVGDITDATTGIVQFVDEYQILQTVIKSATFYALAKGIVSAKNGFAGMIADIKNVSYAMNMASSSSAMTKEQFASFSVVLSGLSDKQLKLVLSNSNLSESEMIKALTIDGTTEAEARQRLATLGITQANQQATAATFSLNGSMKALFATISANPIMVLTMAFTALVSIYQKVQREQEEARKTAVEMAEKYDEQATALQNLRQEYINIVDSESDVSKKTEELNEWKKTLIETYGFEKEALENVNLEREKGLGLLDDEITKNRINSAETWLTENNKAYEDAKKKLTSRNNTTETSVIARANVIENVTKDTLKEYSSNFDEILKQLSISNPTKDNPLAQIKINGSNTLQQYENLNKLLNDITSIKVTKGLNKAEEDLYNSLLAKQKEYKKVVTDDIKDIYETGNKYTNSIKLFNFETDNGINFNNVTQDTYKEFRDKFLESLGFGDKKDSTAFALDVEQTLLDMLPDFEKVYRGIDDNTADIVQETNDAIANSAETASKSLEDLQKAYDELSKSASNFTKNQKSITSAFEEQEKYGQLSASTIQELTEAGYAQALVVDSETGAVTLNKQAYEQLNNEKKTAIKLEAEHQKSDLEQKYNDESKAVSDLTLEMQYANAERRKAISLEISQHYQNMAEYLDMIDKINSSTASLDAPTFEDGKKETPTEIQNFLDDYAKYRHDINMGIKKEDEDYFNWLEKAAHDAYSKYPDYQDDLWKYEEEVYKGRKQLAEDFYDEQQKLFEDRVSNLETNIEVVTKYSTDADGNKLNIEEKYDYISSAYQEIINEINARIGEILDAGIEGHEDEVAELEKQITEYQEKLSDVFKSAVEEEQDYIEKQKDAYSDLYDERIDKIKEQQKVAEEAAQAEIDAVQEKIDALKQANEKAEEANEIEKARQELANASQRTRQVYGADGSISFQVDQDKVKEAQEKLDKLLQEQQINILEEQKQTLEDAKNKASESYDRIIENLETEKENGEKRFNKLIEKLDEYLNPNNGESNSDVWKAIAKLEGGKYENGIYTDKDGNVIDIDKLIDSAETKTDDKKPETDNAKTDTKDNGVITGTMERMTFGSEKSDIDNEVKDKTESAIDTFFSNLEKKLNMPSGSINLENAMQVFRNSPMMNFNPYGAMNDRTGLANKEYVNNVNNNNNAANVTVGDIVINNPVGNSDDLAKELALNIPIAFQKQMYSNLK